MANEPDYFARNIFVGLEELFDIRLSVLADNYPDRLKEIIDAGYFKRERDEFPIVGLTYDDFNNLYEKRDGSALTGALKTHIFDMVGSALYRFVEESIAEPFRGIPTLRINTYPYLLEDEVKKELEITIQTIFGLELPFAFDWVRLSHREIDAKWLGKEHIMIIMYDCLKWMDVAGESMADSNK